MGSVVSSENEGPPEDLCRVCGHPWERHTTSLPEEGRQNYCAECDEATEFHTFAPACSSVHGQGGHCFHSSFGGKCCSCPAVCEPPSPEPKGSEGSSSDDRCAKCGHSRRSHLGEPGAQCLACPSGDKEAWGHAFVKTKAEASPDDLCVCGVRRRDHSPSGGCPGALGRGGQTFQLAASEAAGEPECDHGWTDWAAVYHGGPYQWRKCTECGATDHREVEPASEPEAPECEGCEHPDHGDEPCGQCPCGHPVPAPVVPSRAVVYATGSGALYELVLPDEMTCAVMDGALVLSHPSGVLGIQQVKPMEGA